MKTHTLTEAPTYRALSYVWGTTSQSETIICSGKELKVTLNLHATLSTLRNNPLAGYTAEDGTAIESDLPLWIDQICINQNDESERAQQVRIMKDIYQQASLVLINLGEDFDNAIGTTVSNLVEHINGICLSAKGLRKNPRLDFPKDELLHYWGLPARTDESWPALRSAMRLPYFERVWVVQEVLMARDAVILFPGGLIRWDAFIDAFGWLRAKHFDVPDPSLEDPQDEISFPHILHVYWHARHAPEQRKLYDLVRKTDRLKSTDSRDKIFALAGLALDGNEVEISYAKSRMQVFEEFARHTIRSEKSLGILSDAQQANAEDRGSPSWVPRWDKQPISPSMLDTRFDAALGTKASVDLDRVQGMLKVSGLEIDVVTAKTQLTGQKWLPDLYDCFVELASIIPGTTPKDVVSQKVRDMTWCLVLGKYFVQGPGGVLFSHMMDDALLDDFCAFILNYFYFFGHIKKDKEAAAKLIPLAQIVFEAHHLYPIATMINAAFTQTYDWLELRELFASVEPSLSEDAQKLDELVSYLLRVFTREPGRDMGFKLHCEAEGAVGWPGRSLFGTGKGFIGVGPPQLEKDDIICVLYGGPTLYALRPTSVPGEYTYLGDCYVHGLMYGEALNSSQAEEKTFRLM